MASFTFMQINSADRAGIVATIVAGALSLGAVVLFGIYLTARMLRRPAGMSSLMGDSHMTAYFYSMLLANIFKSGSVVMSAAYLPTDLMVNADNYCFAQAGLKLLGNVGSAVWSLVIAVHVFNLLFRMLRPNRWGLPAVLAGTWALLAAGVLFGPVALNRPTAFFGVDPSLSNGSPCWITEEHVVARFLLEYFPTGASVAGSALLLGATFLHMRGNIYFTGSRVKVRWLSADDAWHNARMRDEVDTKVLMTVKRMVCFPIAYLVLWAPVAVARLISVTGHQPSFGFVAFSLTTYALTGFTDVMLYVVTRRVILPSGAVTPVYVDVGNEWDDEKKVSPAPPSRAMTTAPPAYPRALVLGTHHRAASADSAYSVDSAAVASSTLPEFRTPASPAPSYATRTILMPQPTLSPVRAAVPFTPSVRARSPSLRSFISDSQLSRSPSDSSVRPPPPAARRARSGSVSSAGSSPASSVGSRARAGSVSSAGSGARLGLGAATMHSRYASPAASLGGRTFGSPASSGPPLSTLSSATSLATIPSTRTDSPPSIAQVETGGTFGGAETFRALANSGALIEPLAPQETVKAQLYGARFSLVAGPTPAYDYDRAT